MAPSATPAATFTKDRVRNPPAHRSPYTTRFLDAAQRFSTATVKARNYDGNQLTIPIISQQAKKDRNDVRPTAWFGDGTKSKRSIAEKQVMLSRTYEDVIGLRNQPILKQLNGHRRVFQQNFVQGCLSFPQMVHNNDRCAHIRGRMADNAGEGIEASGRTSESRSGKMLNQVNRL